MNLDYPGFCVLSVCRWRWVQDVRCTNNRAFHFFLLFLSLTNTHDVEMCKDWDLPGVNSRDFFAKHEHKTHKRLSDSHYRKVEPEITIRLIRLRGLELYTGTLENSDMIKEHWMTKRTKINQKLEDVKFPYGNAHIAIWYSITNQPTYDTAEDTWATTNITVKFVRKDLWKRENSVDTWLWSMAHPRLISVTYVVHRFHTKGAWKITYWSVITLPSSYSCKI